MARTLLVNMMLSSTLVVGLALLVVAEGDPIAVPECPKNSQRNETVQIPHETDCTKYYTCLGSEKVLRECPFMDDDHNRLYYNPELHLCDWPWNVACHLPYPVTTTKKTLVGRNPIPTECPRVDSKYKTVNLAHEWDCTKFYTCLQGTRILMSCPYDGNGNKLYFNPSEQVCDWPYNVDCRMPQSTIKKGLPACYPPTTCPRVDRTNQTVHLAYEWDCTKFYKCLQGEKLLMSCPSDKYGNKLYFNPCLQVCDWPYNVDCFSHNDLSSPKIESSSSNGAYPSKCPKVDPKNETIVLAYPGDATKYYICSHGKQIVMDCPTYDKEGGKLCFNPEIHQCDWPENVGCDQSKLLSKRKISEPRAGLPTKCPKDDTINETVLLPHERDCTKFYMCSHGKKVRKQCPEFDDGGKRLYFNFEKQICDWPSNVNCMLPEPVIRAAMVRGEILPVPTECPAKDTPEYTVHLAHEWDCTKFYKCFQGKKVLQFCPKNLHYNKYEQVCDWPWEAGCDSDMTTSYPPTTSAPTRPPTTKPTQRPTTPKPTYRPTTTPKPTHRPTTTPKPTHRPTTPEPTRPAPTTTPNPGIEGCLDTCPDNDPPNFITALPHADCRKWCRCENNEVTVWTCPGNLQFSPTLRKCTTAEIAGCEKKKHQPRSQDLHNNDEALMNLLGYNKRFIW